jgi:hypothetical protein
VRHVAILAFLITAGCEDRPRQLDAMVYLEDGLEPHQSIRGFKSFELCQEAISRLPQAVRQNAYLDCGYQCRYEPKYGTTICKETRD